MRTIKNLLLWLILFSIKTVFAQVSPNDFVTTWKTDNTGVLSNDSAIYITAGAGVIITNYDVDWNNDGSFDTLGVTGDISHQYSSPGTYTVRIRGTFPYAELGVKSFAFIVPRDEAKLIEINQWGDNAFRRLCFKGCNNLNILAIDAPILDSLDGNNLNHLFAAATSLNADINHWDVSSVKSMVNIFAEAKSFNQPINNWDVSNVNYMGGFFAGASSFNQPLSNWDVSNVNSMVNMFSQATSFNQDLHNWNVSNVMNMAGMFLNAKAFDQNLGDWDISAIQNTSVPLYTGMFTMLDSSGLSQINYDSTLIGWNNQPYPMNIYLGSEGLTYCIAKEVRDSLLANGWFIYGDSLDPNCSSISEVEHPPTQQIKVYPNPSSGSFIIQFSNEPFTGELKIHSLSGQLVHHQKVTNQEQLKLYLSLAKGMYMLKLSSDSQQLIERLIIQ